MIKHQKLTLKKSACVSLVCLMCLHASYAFSRTLIFQSDTQTTTNETNQAMQPATNNVDQLATAGTNTNTVNTPLPNASSANSELFFMIEQLQSEVNSLRGLLEEQAHELRMLKQSGKDRYLDLDTRILDLTKRVSQSATHISPEAASLPAKQSVTQVPTKQPSNANVDPKQAIQEIKQREPTASEQQAYDDAYALIKNKMFDESILALFNYTENYPESPLMPNVYYWLGEVYLATSKLEQAKTSFSLVISAYPSNPKVPDSLYKLAVTLDRMGESALSQKYLTEVQDKFPNSTASKLASSYKQSD